MRPVLFLDVSRLHRRFATGMGGPTGIDRIELAYAAWLGRQRTFAGVAVARRGKGLRVLRPGALEQIIEALEARWSHSPLASGPLPAPGPLPASGSLPAPGRIGMALRALRAQALFGGGLDAGGARSVYLNVGHDGLDVAARYDRLPGAFAALVSDVIPLTHPEYETPRATRLHAARLQTLAQRADHVAFVSVAAQEATLSLIAAPVRFSTSVAHLAPTLPVLPRAPRPHPTFVHISSLDLRKNVALLLHIWRDLAAAGGMVPHLTLIGRRGNDRTVGWLLDRCEALRPHVTVRGTASDQEAARALAGATALLSPSFVEGFGLPVWDARAAGVPVVASDIPAHREIAGPHTLLLDPLDGPAWKNAVARLSHERPCPPQETLPSWEDHLTTMEPELERIARAR